MRCEAGIIPTAECSVTLVGLEAARPEKKSGAYVPWHVAPPTVFAAPEVFRSTAGIANRYNLCPCYPMFCDVAH